MQRRLLIVKTIVLTTCVMLALTLILEMQGAGYSEAAVRQSQTVLTAGTAAGTIYDRHFVPLVNRETVLYAAVPDAASAEMILPYMDEVTPLLAGVQSGKPFLCKISADPGCEDIPVLSLPVRSGSRQPAPHVIGYTQSGEGVTGLEHDYDRILRSTNDRASVTYVTDARGHVLLGEPVTVRQVQGSDPSLVTTLDADIQRLCEGLDVEKGAVVVMDVESGDVLAMASFPAYDPADLAAALDDPDSPLIDRCLCAYSVGSIFKLVTCAAAYLEGILDFETECTGKTEISGQLFRCHDWRGHGLVDMRQAMVYSCNTYFVELSELLDPAVMLETAQDLGFGTQIALSGSIVSSGGTLPSPAELKRPAEMANFCFGQGLLTATPLQVTQMTCGIANNGRMPLARLIRGYTTDGETLLDEKQPMYAYALRRQAAYYLQGLMISAINENESSNAVPETVIAAAKTSTAQTGRYDEDGQEYCHAWITGYFPIEAPRYAVTVLVEDGGYGNDAAAPLFRELADGITALHR
ncbi:MAG: hypothetical protein K5695_09245 [Oscillospiraceae bacterium]|nr:hypothetical protein [Oscillospiraceae bacterium]